MLSRYLVVSEFFDALRHNEPALTKALVQRSENHATLYEVEIITVFSTVKRERKNLHENWDDHESSGIH